MAKSHGVDRVREGGEARTPQRHPRRPGCDEVAQPQSVQGTIVRKAVGTGSSRTWRGQCGRWRSANGGRAGLTVDREDATCQAATAHRVPPVATAARLLDEALRTLEDRADHGEVFAPRAALRADLAEYPPKLLFHRQVLRLHANARVERREQSTEPHARDAADRAADDGLHRAALARGLTRVQRRLPGLPLRRFHHRGRREEQLRRAHATHPSERARATGHQLTGQNHL